MGTPAALPALGSALRYLPAFSSYLGLVLLLGETRWLHLSGFVPSTRTFPVGFTAAWFYQRWQKEIEFHLPIILSSLPFELWFLPQRFPRTFPISSRLRHPWTSA